MLKRVFALFSIVMLFSVPVCLSASVTSTASRRSMSENQAPPVRLNNPVDRWEWLFSTDKVGFFFDTNTIKFGTKEKMNNKTYKYYKVVDESKIIVFMKFVYSDAGIEYLTNNARNRRYNGLADIMENGRYNIVKYEFDYANQKYRYSHGTWYDENGNALTNFTDEMTPWEDIYPNTNVETWATLIYSYATNNYNTVAQQTNTFN